MSFATEHDGKNAGEIITLQYDASGNARPRLVAASKCVKLLTSGKRFREMYIPHTPLLFSENGVCKGINLFLLQNIDCGYSLEPTRQLIINLRFGALRICV